MNHARFCTGSGSADALCLAHIAPRRSDQRHDRDPYERRARTSRMGTRIGVEAAFADPTVSSRPFAQACHALIERIAVAPGLARSCDFTPRRLIMASYARGAERPNQAMPRDALPA